MLRAGSTRPLDEELHRNVGRNLFGCFPSGVGEEERIDGQLVLTAQAERSAAGGQHLDGGARNQQTGDERRNPDQEMLAVVQQQQRLPRAQMANHRLVRGLIRRRDEPACPGCRVADERGVGQRRQIDPDHTIGEAIAMWPR